MRLIEAFFLFWHIVGAIVLILAIPAYVYLEIKREEYVERIKKKGSTEDKLYK